jgi:hypothetical protein
MVRSEIKINFALNGAYFLRASLPPSAALSSRACGLQFVWAVYEK